MMSGPHLDDDEGQNRGVLGGRSQESKQVLTWIKTEAIHFTLNQGLSGGVCVCVQVKLIWNLDSIH